MTQTMWWLIIIAVAIGIALYSRSQVSRAYRDSSTRENNNKRIYTEELSRINLDSYQRSLDFAIYQSLSQMDETCDFFTDEDEASRELTTCLNLLGHNARYHWPIGNGRTVDIFLDNTIVEGKLNPKQSDIDRLIGQIDDYLTYPHSVFIVLYGQVNQAFIDRIKSQIIDRNPSRVSLVYLPNATRIKRVETTDASRVVFAKG